MRRLILILLSVLININLQAQSCDEIMKFVKSEGGYGTTFTSYNSDAISKVTFYQLTADYKTLYFAIVCFKEKSSYGCTEYIYQVGPNTKLSYSMNYLTSAGKAFWEYIHPYSKNLDCAPNFG